MKASWTRGSSRIKEFPNSALLAVGPEPRVRAEKERGRVAESARAPEG